MSHDRSWGCTNDHFTVTQNDLRSFFHIMKATTGHVWDNTASSRNNELSFFPLSLSLHSLSHSSGHGSYQHALCAPHGGLWRFLHRSSRPAANLRCLLEVHVHAPHALMALCHSTHTLLVQTVEIVLTILAPAAPIHKDCSLCVSFAMPTVQWGLIRNKWFNYSGWWGD